MYFYRFDQSSWLWSNPEPQDRSNSEWKENPCLLFEDDELLVEGMIQAQRLTKTAVVENSLPPSIGKLVESLPDEVHENVNRYFF